MSGEIRYYRGLHKVKVLTKSEGYWIVEALEDFVDCVDGCQIKVKLGEQRIVQPNLVHKGKILPPMVKEHTYELQMEKKLKQIVEKQEEKQAKPKTQKKTTV